MTSGNEAANALGNKKRAVETARFLAQQLDDNQSAGLSDASD